MSIEVKGLTKQFGTQKAVNEVTFKVNKGEICGFLGPNGAGKTTTMKMLSCFTIPTSGEAHVAGFNVEEHPFEVRRQLGYLPEHNPLYKRMFVAEYLHFVGQLYKLKDIRSRVEEMIDITGLTRERNKKIGALSKGYRQRVGLAQAMIHDPQVLILDEPTSGLDPNQLAEIRNLILTLGQDKTVLFSSHIMQEVEAVCDRILIINQGKLVADESKDALKQRLQGNSRIKIQFEKPVFEKSLKNIKGVTRIDVHENCAYTIWSDDQEDLRKPLFLFAKQNDHVILELKKADVSVEMIFQQLTRERN